MCGIALDPMGKGVVPVCAIGAKRNAAALPLASHPRLWPKEDSGGAIRAPLRHPDDGGLRSPGLVGGRVGSTACTGGRSKWAPGVVPDHKVTRKPGVMVIGGVG